MKLPPRLMLINRSSRMAPSWLIRLCAHLSSFARPWGDRRLLRTNRYGTADIQVHGKYINLGSCRARAFFLDLILHYNGSFTSLLGCWSPISHNSRPEDPFHSCSGISNSEFQAPTQTNRALEHHSTFQNEPLTRPGPVLLAINYHDRSINSRTPLCPNTEPKVART